MIRFLLLAVVLGWYSRATAQSAQSAQTGTIIVKVVGIQADKGGELSTGVFRKENFPKVGKQLLKREAAVSGSEMQVVFNNVPAGTYGLVSFQDIDKNKDLKTNFVGFPKEPIGFSRDAKINLGPPNFEDAAITLEAGKTVNLVITLR